MGRIHSLGERLPIIGGAARGVGAGWPSYSPELGSLARFLHRFADAYDTKKAIAGAPDHCPRGSASPLLWIHPFYDGNRRVTRGLARLTAALRVSNWKRRGISKEGKLRAASIIGFRIPWLETGKGLMTETAPDHAVRQSDAVSYLPERTNPVITEVVEIMSHIDDIGRGMILMSARKIAEERHLISSKPSLST